MWEQYGRELLNLIRMHWKLIGCCSSILYFNQTDAAPSVDRVRVVGFLDYGCELTENLAVGPALIAFAHL